MTRAEPQPHARPQDHRRTMSQQKIPQKLIPWVEAKRRYRLTDEQVQMARELGLNPTKLGKLANHKQEPWKLPLPQFIEENYQRRFKQLHPKQVVALD
jgi:phage terminase small subunit